MYRYILRYCIDPGFHPHERIAELAAFCSESEVEEVMLFITPEELSPGFPLECELDAYIAMAQRLKRALAAEGVELSLNPWSALYAVPRGRTFRAGQCFRPMVGETGKASPVVPCPLCEEWQAYLCATFARMAQAIAPVTLWVEDDWRLHNHGSELGWGGCFCPEHLARFSPDEPVSREQLLATLLAEGAPHPWRERWLALSRETLLEPLKRLASAIRTASPATRLGLMSSMPDQHSAEGRDWAALESLLGDSSTGGLLLRPHMRPYTEERAMRITPAVTRQTIACVSPRAIIYPELENSPRSGIYSKSAAGTVWQMLESTLLGCRGITINHFDMLGNGIALDPRFGPALAKAKPWLTTLASLNLDDRKAHGPQVLFSPLIAGHLQVAKRAPGLSAQSLALQDPTQQSRQGGADEADEHEGMQQLIHSSLVWSETCALLGLPHRLTATPGPGVILISGQTPRAFDDHALRAMLREEVVLDAEAALCLLEMGYGEAIGLHRACWRTLDETAFSYEVILDGAADEYGVDTPRMSAQRCATRLLEMEHHDGAEILTRLYRADHRPLFAGCCRHTNAAGGRITSLAYPLDGKAQFFMGFFNRFRQRLLREIAGSRWFMACDGLRCYQHQTERGLLLALLNPTNDPLPEINLLPPRTETAGEWFLLRENGAWEACDVRRKRDGLLVAPAPIAPLSAVILERRPSRARSVS